MSASKKKKKNKKKTSVKKHNKNLQNKKELNAKENSSKNLETEGLKSKEVEVTKEEIKKKSNKKDRQKENTENVEIKENVQNQENLEQLEEKQELGKTEKEEIKKQAENETAKESTKNKDEKPKKSNKDKESKALTKTEGTKEIANIEEKPEYVKDLLAKKRRKTIIFICITLIILIIITLSTIFALLNLNNTNIISGIKIKDIEVAGLSIEDAKSKLNQNLEDELLDEITLKYNDEYEITLAPSQIQFEYDIDSAVNEAYSVGRNGNILQNNYEILATTLFGKNQKITYTYNEDILNEFIDDVSSKIPGVVVNPTYYIEDENLIVCKGTDGISVIKEDLKEKIIKSILNRKYEEINSENYNPIIEIPTEETKAEDIDIEQIYSEVKTEPQDAYYELDPYQIYAEKDGIDFDLENAKEILKEDNTEYTIPLIITKAEKTIQDLGTEAFPYLISSFSTKYDASNTNRSTNLEIAANKINGTVLMPGETFSFNKVVGKRTVEEGYKDAKIYADGGVVDGLAGGICQISSTLYNAVLLANLEIVERRNHSYPTSYVSVGRDATVVYGSIDFQFKNSRNYPIKIEASVKNGVAEFKIHGMQEETEYEIKILPVTTASIPYSTQYVQDATLPTGQQVVAQSGKAGYKVTTYIEKWLNGECVSREVLSNDTYSPMQTIIHIGP